MSYAEQEVFELRQRVSRLERQVAFLLERLEFEYVDRPDDEVSPEIIDLVRRGNKLGAIKLYRQETGASLRTAKDFVDALFARYR